MPAFPFIISVSQFKTEIKNNRDLPDILCQIFLNPESIQATEPSYTEMEQIAVRKQAAIQLKNYIKRHKEYPKKPQVFTAVSGLLGDINNSIRQDAAQILSAIVYSIGLESSTDQIAEILQQTSAAVSIEEKTTKSFLLAEILTDNEDVIKRDYNTERYALKQYAYNFDN